jgi:hypothetical protein
MAECPLRRAKLIPRTREQAGALDTTESPNTVSTGARESRGRLRRTKRLPNARQRRRVRRTRYQALGFCRSYEKSRPT